MALIDNVIVFVVSLLIGALGIYVGARLMADVDDYTYAIITALVGAIVWAVAAYLVGWIPLLGPLLVLAAYVGVIHWRYPGGVGEAVGIALVAWVTAFVVLYVLSLVNVIAPEAMGVPGV